MNTSVQTGGGTYVQGDVDTTGDFVGRDKIQININLERKNFSQDHPQTQNHDGVDGQLTSIQQLNLVGHFHAPHFIDQIHRTDLLLKIQELTTSYPVICVEGLSGVGKSYLVSSFIDSKYFTDTYHSVLWYDPGHGDTLDSLFAHLEPVLCTRSVTITSKCKEFLHELRNTHSLLVVDNYERIDANSYRTLLDLAVGYGTPSSILLISQIYTELFAHISSIGHLEIPGFDVQATTVYLHSRKISKIKHEVIRDLREKTDGLPFAISLFVTLVRDFHRDPEDLLNGKLLKSDRLCSWFVDVCSNIGEDELRVLRFLSLCDIPFNIGLFNMVCSHEACSNIDGILINLEKSFLIQRYSNYRFNIHSLVTQLCQIDLAPLYRRERYLLYAQYYLRGVDVRKHRLIEHRIFLDMLVACEYLQKAKVYTESAKIISSISFTAKSNGFYDVLLRLSETEVRENPNRNSWIDYDYAHCCLITGQLKRSLAILEPLLYHNLTSDKDIDKKIAITRLYAEVLGTMGKFQLALEKLTEVLGDSEKRAIHPSYVVVAHAKSVQTWLFTNLGQYDAAESLAQELLAEGIRQKHKRSVAVALTRWGIIDLHKRNFDIAQSRLTQALEIFQEVGDTRGQGWCLARLALAEIELCQHAKGIALIQDAMKIWSDIGSNSIDDLHLLKNIKSKVKDDAVVRKIDVMIDQIQQTFANMID